MDIEKECLKMANHIICAFDLSIPQISNIRSLQLRLYCDVFKTLFKDTMKDLIDTPVTIKEDIHNIQSILNLLSKLDIDVDHIKAIGVVKRDVMQNFYLLSLIDVIVNNVGESLITTLTNNSNYDARETEIKIKSDAAHKRQESSDSSSSISNSTSSISEAHVSRHKKKRIYKKRYQLNTTFKADVPSLRNDETNTPSKMKESDIVSHKGQDSVEMDDDSSKNARCERELAIQTFKHLQKPQRKGHVPDFKKGVIINHKKIEAEVSYKNYRANHEEETPIQLLSRRKKIGSGDIFDYLSRELPFTYLSSSTKRRMEAQYDHFLKVAVRNEWATSQQEVNQRRELCELLAQHQIQTELHKRETELQHRLTDLKEQTRCLMERRALHRENKTQRIRTDRYFREYVMDHRARMLTASQSRDDLIVRDVFGEIAKEYQDDTRGWKRAAEKAREDMLRDINGKLRDMGLLYQQELQMEEATSKLELNKQLEDRVLERDRQREMISFRQGLQADVHKSLTNMERSMIEDDPFRYLDAKRLISQVKKGHSTLQQMTHRSRN